jgi:16S rRNA (cytosine967-C5)-methyltransferase
LEVIVALRIGLFEAVHLGVPAPVATDAAVHLCRRLGKSSAAGMVNAVLRRAPGRWQHVMTSEDAGERWSHPEWLANKWQEDHGEQGALSAMESDQTEATLWAWFVDSETRNRLEQEGLNLEQHPWCPDCWSAPGNSRRLIVEIENGRAYAQDPSSQLVAIVGKHFVKDGGRVVDLCAAPGGKAALLLTGANAATAWAFDLQLKRVRLARRPLTLVPNAIRLGVADAGRPPLRKQSWDFVLLDAPCSGTGTLRRHPEIRWRLDRDELSQLAKEQIRMLRSGLELLGKEGVLLYSTCSIEPEENEGVVEDVLKQVEVVDLSSALPHGVPAQTTRTGGIRLLPNQQGDGFTIHAMRVS